MDYSSEDEGTKVPNGQAKKGTRGMPWHQEPMKDVISCEKIRGAANRLRSVYVRMGKPHYLKNSDHYVNT